MMFDVVEQQGVVQLRPSDLIRVVQEGRDKLLLVQSVIDAIRALADDEIITSPVPPHTHIIADVITLTASLAALIPLTQKGAANGVAPLDSSSKISSTYLPSYVDDVLEFANLAAFPGTGETGKIYIAQDTNRIYRWTGAVYTLLSVGTTDSITEGATNLYYTNERAQDTVASMLTAGSGVSLTYNDPANTLTVGLTAPTVSQVTKTIGTVYQITSARGADLFFSVRITIALTVLAGAEGYVVLETASNNTFTTNVVEWGRFNSAGGAGLVMNQSVGGELTGYCAVNYYYRLRSVNVTGTPTYTYISGVESLR